MLKSYRKYGDRPYSIFLVHGGPGSVGDMKPVAERLSSRYGVIETLHTADSVNGQVEELRRSVCEESDPPVILIGHSWGAWLTILFTARHPSSVEKLILVCSPPFEKKYVPDITAKRMQRLDEGERENFHSLIERSGEGEIPDGFIDLMDKTDMYDPIENYHNGQFHPEVNKKVWREASMLRESGRLLKLCNNIDCPVIAIHGDHDPHPYEGVKEPLSRTLGDVRFIQIEKCGHYPWRENKAKERFYEVLRSELD